jgi:uncharacterized damage-inducible protein DinB
MKRLQSVFAAVIIVVACVSGAVAGEEPAPGPFQKVVTGDLDFVAKRFSSLAEAIPAEKYGWRPTEEVRTVSEIFMHVAGANMLMPSMFGAAPPEGIQMPEKPFELAAEWEAKVTAKEEVLKKLAESFAYASQAINAMPAADMDTEIELFGFKAQKRVYVMIVTTHAHEHLGQAIAYARSIGVVPPWSRKPAAPAEKPKEEKPAEETAE